MKPLAQRLEDGCFLACLESFLRENGRCDTQEEMRDRFLPKQYCSSKGAVIAFKDGELTHYDRCLCEELGVFYEDMGTGFPLVDASLDSHFLITTHAKGEHHCMRYHAGQVMDPSGGIIRPFTQQEFDNRECKCHRISMAVGGQRSP